MTINGVDFTGAEEKRGVPIALWRAAVDFTGGAGTLSCLRQLPSRQCLFQAVLNEDPAAAWAIDAPFGLAKSLLLGSSFDHTKPLWSPDNFALFEQTQGTIPAGGNKRQTDSLCPGTAGAFSKQLRRMTYQAIALLSKLAAAVAPESIVFPWSRDGRILEVFPGSAATALAIPGVTCNSYKKHPKSEAAVLQRAAIVDRVVTGTPGVFPAVAISAEQRDLCIGSDDALDAVLAALCGIWHVRNLGESLRTRKQLAEHWPVEGMIVGPTGGAP